MHASIFSQTWWLHAHKNKWKTNTKAYCDFFIVECIILFFSFFCCILLIQFCFWLIFLCWVVFFFSNSIAFVNAKCVMRCLFSSSQSRWTINVFHFDFSYGLYYFFLWEFLFVECWSKTKQRMRMDIQKENNHSSNTKTSVFFVINPKAFRLV